MLGDTNGTPRRALALAGGGVVGGLYEVGVLLALDAVFENFTTADFDFYVGSSAGAFVATLLVNGVTPAQIRDALESDADALPRLSGARFVSLPWRAYLATLPRLAVTVPRLAYTSGSTGARRSCSTRSAPCSPVAGGCVHVGRGRGVRAACPSRRGRTTTSAATPPPHPGDGAGHGRDPRLRRAGERAHADLARRRRVGRHPDAVRLRIDGIDYIDAMVTKTAHAGPPPTAAPSSSSS
jgi:hypothetical protein